jgi:hypothetical protein
VTNEEEDEIFFGPVCFTERLKEAVVKEEEVPPLSPLNAKQFALMVKEANYVAYRIRNSKTSSGSESSPEGSKTSCPSADEEISPSIRKHTRSGTFTKCPLELLPEEIRKVLPVIGDSEKAASNANDCQKTLLTSTEEHHASEIVSTNKVDEKSNMNTVQSNVKRPSIGRIQQPSKFQGSKLSKPTSIKVLIMNPMQYNYTITVDICVFMLHEIILGGNLCQEVSVLFIKQIVIHLQSGITNDNQIQVVFNFDDVEFTIAELFPWKM